MKLMFETMIDFENEVRINIRNQNIVLTEFEVMGCSKEKIKSM
jgi:hypothetical protein